jgi:Helix-turn-helix domain
MTGGRAKSKVGTFNLFEWLRGLTDGDLLTRLGPAELCVLLIFARHANSNGVSWPGPGSIAQRIGASVRTAERAISGLTGKEFLQTVTAGGGRGNPAHRRLTIPSKTPAQDVGVCSPETPTRRDTKPRHGATLNPDNGRLETPAQDVGGSIPLTTHELPYEENKAGEGEIPRSLRTENFLKAWGEWQQHRREIRKKLTPLAARRQLARLEAMGSTRAVAAIEHSIQNGWTGIFESKDAHSGNGQSRHGVKNNEGLIANAG